MCIKDKVDECRLWGLIEGCAVGKLKEAMNGADPSVNSMTILSCWNLERRDGCSQSSLKCFSFWICVATTVLTRRIRCWFVNSSSGTSLANLLSRKSMYSERKQLGTIRELVPRVMLGDERVLCLGQLWSIILIIKINQTMLIHRRSRIRSRIEGAYQLRPPCSL